MVRFTSITEGARVLDFNSDGEFLLTLRVGTESEAVDGGFVGGSSGKIVVDLHASVTGNICAVPSGTDPILSWSEGVWSHVVVVVEPTYINIYHNGQNVYGYRVWSGGMNPKLVSRECQVHHPRLRGSLTLRARRHHPASRLERLRREHRIRKNAPHRRRE